MFWHTAVMLPLLICPPHPSLSEVTARCLMRTARPHVVYAGLGDETGWQQTAGKTARKHAALTYDDDEGNAKPTDGDTLPSLRT